MKEVPLSQQKEFRPIKNAIIHEAERIRLGQFSFEDNEVVLREASESSLPNSKLIAPLWNRTQDRSFDLEYRQDAMADLEAYAEMGIAYAQYCTGKLYRDGGIVIPDAEIAKAWFEKAAAQSFSPAQYALGDLLLSNDLLVRDRSKGLQWLKAAAENGSSAAQYRMGRDALEHGNREAAGEWFQKAAAQKNPYAQYMLGKLYLKDGQKEKALEYFSLAAAQGHSYAQYFLDRHEQLRPPTAMLAVTRLLRSLSRIFQDNAQRQHAPGRLDRKRRMELLRKREALGIRGQLPEDDYDYSQSM